MSTSNRASLLANLRTGGVRSTTNPVPQTAAPHITAFQHVEQYPMTAALHGSFAPMYSVQASQNQAFQMQAMQMEILRLQVCSPLSDCSPFHDAAVALSWQLQFVSPLLCAYVISPATSTTTAVSTGHRPTAATCYATCIAAGRLHRHGCWCCDSSPPCITSGAT